MQILVASDDIDSAFFTDWHQPVIARKFLFCLRSIFFTLNILLIISSCFYQHVTHWFAVYWFDTMWQAFHSGMSHQGSACHVCQSSWTHDVQLLSSWGSIGECTCTNHILHFYIVLCSHYHSGLRTNIWLGTFALIHFSYCMLMCCRWWWHWDRKLCWKQFVVSFFSRTVYM